MHPPGGLDPEADVAEVRGGPPEKIEVSSAHKRLEKPDVDRVDRGAVALQLLGEILEVVDGDCLHLPL